MPLGRRTAFALLAALAGALFAPPLAGAQSAPPTPPPRPTRDGQHDFDFELGTWKIHLAQLLHPLTGSTTWVQFDGTSVTRKVWDGRSQLEEFEVDRPSGHI